MGFDGKVMHLCTDMNSGVDKSSTLVPRVIQAQLRS